MPAADRGQDLRGGGDRGAGPRLRDHAGLQHGARHQGEEEEGGRQEGQEGAMQLQQGIIYNTVYENNGLLLTA